MSKTSSSSQNQPPMEPTVGMMLGDTNKRLHGCFHKVSEALGMPQSYHPFLRHLDHEDGVTQLELSRKVHLSAPTVSVTLAKMERDNLLIRRQDTKDQRIVRVFLTEEGRRVNHRIHMEIQKVDRCLIDGFTEEECLLIKALLKRMNENLEGMNL